MSPFPNNAIIMKDSVACTRTHTRTHTPLVGPHTNTNNPVLIPSSNKFSLSDRTYKCNDNETLTEMHYGFVTVKKNKLYN